MRLARLPRSPSVIGGLDPDDPRVLAFDIMLMEAADTFAESQIDNALIAVSKEAMFFARIEYLLEQIRNR